ncbi:MAG: UDP binding domain-containing protein, partial [Bradyrhizobium sp.]
DLLNAVEEIDDKQTSLLAETVLDCVGRASARLVGILGLAYKERTPVISGSSALRLIRRLLQADVQVVGYDELARENARAELGGAIEFTDTPERCVAAAPVVVLLNRDPSYAAAVVGYHGTQRRSVVDCWRMLDGVPVPAVIDVVRLGYHRA